MRERTTLQDLLCEAAWHLLQQQDEPDPALQALYDKHADDAFGEAQQQDHEDFIDLVERMTGVDLGDDAMDHSHVAADTKVSQNAGPFR